MCGSIACLLPGLAAAQALAPEPPPLPHDGLRIIPSLDARVVHTNNAGPDTFGQPQSDVVTEVQPSISFERKGPHVALNGTLSVSELDYLHNTQERRTLTRARVDMASKVIDGLLFLDGWARVDPTFEDPFAAQPEAQTAYKMESQRRYSLSPYILHKFDDTANLLVRSDYLRARSTDAVTSLQMNTTTWDHTLSLSHDPRPFGAQIEANKHTETNDLQSDTSLNTESARFWLNYAITPQVIVGVDKGRERVSSALTAPFVDHFQGGRIQLKPTDHTDVDVRVERRYFGEGWDVNISQRTRMLSFSLHSSRIVSTQDIPDTSALSALNTATPVVPTPGGNTAVVPVNALTRYASVPELRESTGVEIDLRGRRNLVYLQLGYLKTQVLENVFPIDNSSDILQKSAVLGWNLQATPLTALNFIAEWHHAVRLAGIAQGEYSTQMAGRGEIVFTMSPTSFVTFGARKSSIRSNYLTGYDMNGELAIYAGLRHRF